MNIIGLGITVDADHILEGELFVEVGDVTINIEGDTIQIWKGDDALFSVPVKTEGE
jgi:hypothetical protein